MKMLTAEGLQKLLQKVKTVFATKTEVNTIVNDLQSPSSTTGQSFVHTTGNETIAGDKTFSSKINLTSSTLFSSQMTGISNADATRAASTKKLVLELKDKNSKRFFGLESEAATNGSRRIYFHLQKRSNDAWVDGYQFKELADGTIQNIVATPPTAANDTQIATTAFVKAQGYITSSGSITGNAATATKIQRNVGNGSYVGAATTGNALVNSTSTTFDAIWNAPTKNYQVACSTWPGNNDNVYLAYSVTKANISSGTNSVAKQCLWNADTGVLSASGGFSGNVTGNCSGTAANVTGTVAIANGGTGATTRLKGLQALTNENVGTSAQYFLTITSSWGKGGYSSTANAKTVLGVTGSDRRIKDDIEEIPDEVLDAWDNVKWNQFRMKKEVRQKGNDAPLHFGSIVQDVQKALSDGGIDPDRYGFLYHEDYLPEEMDLPSEENPEITNGEKWYLKYAEALSIEAAYLRRKCRMLEDRIAALESKGE